MWLEARVRLRLAKNYVEISDSALQLQKWTALAAFHYSRNSFHQSVFYNTTAPKLTMKLAVLSTAAASAAAFAPAAQQFARSSTSTSALHMAEPEKSQALPFAPRPKLLDGTLPGDVGFDPFGFAGDDKASLMNQREAEIKHGELELHVEINQARKG